MHAHADLGEDRGLRLREPELLDRHPGRQLIAIEQPRKEMVSMGIVRASLAAQARHSGWQLHVAATADREALELRALVAGLCRALVLGVEEETHDLRGLVRDDRMADPEFRVIHERADNALRSVVLEHHVAGASLGGLIEKGAARSFSATVATLPIGCASLPQTRAISSSATVSSRRRPGMRLRRLRERSSFLSTLFFE